MEAHPALAYQIDQSAQATLEALFAAEPRLVDFFRNYNKLIEQECEEVVRMAGIDMDITKRKQIKEQLRLLESVVVNANDAIVITEAEPIDEPGPRILYVNQAFTRMTGYSLEEVQGKTPRLLQGSKSDRATLDKIRAALKRWQHVSVELINRGKDGSEFWVEISIVPVANETGWFTHWIAVQRDISDRKQAEVEHNMLLAAEQAARAQAEAANRTKDEFLAIVSHELRSPLNAILGWARLLRTRKFDIAKTAHALEVIERNARLQTQLIEDLLDISRMIRGKLHLTLSKVNLISVIEAAIDVVRATADTKNIQLNCILDPTASAISGDPVRLQQIVWNLLSNAIKFTPEGGKIEICLEQIDNHACLRVSDTGRGINPEFLPYLFARFRQADSSITRLHGGLGLGLAIVRNLVELHNGTIDATSAGEGQGATFIVTLPLLEATRESEVGSTKPISYLALNAQPSALSNLQILVVDDAADTREFITTALEQYGARVTAVASAAEALEAVKQLQPDVLVSDIGMPGENGYSLIRKLRDIEAQLGCGQIPAVALTAYARSEDRAAAIAAGFQIHVRKPVDPAQLAAVVANITRRQ